MNVSGEQNYSCHYDKPPQETCIPYPGEKMNDAGKGKDDVKPGTSPKTQLHNKGDWKDFDKDGSRQAKDRNSCHKEGSVLFHLRRRESGEAQEKKPAVKSGSEKI